MLWQLFRGCARYAEGVGYDVVDNFKAGEVGSLDPVDPALARKANVPRLKGHLRGFVFAFRALMIVSSLTHFVAELAPPSEVRRVPSDDVWNEHLRQLIDFGVIERIEEGLVLFCSSYFAIPKTDGSARAIFNGKRFSRLCRTPPQSRLPDIVTVLRTLEEMCRDCPSITLLEGDIRHYFHQIPMEFDITRYLCINLGGKFYRWKCLPMGLSVSPFVAQAVGMGMILRTLAKVGVDVSSYVGQSTPPSLVIIRNGAAINIMAALWYDNILIAVRDPDLAPRIYTMLRKVLEDCHIVLKSWNLHGPRSLRPAVHIHTGKRQRPDETSTVGKQKSRPPPSYLGLDFTQLRKGPHLQLHWRITEERRAAWKQLLELTGTADAPNTMLSCRQIASISGAVLWRAHVGLIPLCRFRQVLDMVAHCGTLCRKRADWDRTRQWPAAQITALREQLTIATTDEWFTVPMVRVEKELCIATDSSKVHWGACAWTEDRTLLSVEDGSWNAQIRPASIFIKELLAATLAIERACAKYSNTHITLLVDNTAALAVLTRLASCTHAGNELAVRVDNALTNAGNSLKVIHITSEHNPADSPSRRKPLESSRVEAMWRYVDEAKHGRTFETPVRAAPQPSEGLRHPEKATDTDIYGSDTDVDDFDEWNWLSETDD